MEERTRLRESFEKDKKQKEKINSKIRKNHIKHTEKKVEESIDKSNGNAVSYFKLQFSLAKPFDVLIITIGLIASLALSISMPLFAILFGGTLNNLGASALQESFLDLIRGLCLKFVYVGIGMFSAGALMICCWSYSGRIITNYIKEKYFMVVMKQEQGWFDTQEVFEFSTRIQSQTKLIENGIGEKVGNSLMSIGMFIASFVVGFTTSWKLSLVLCSMLPVLIISATFMTKALQEGSKKNRQAFEKAGGIAQEILEKIKTVTSFSNYKYEIDRFDKNLDEGLKAGLLNGFKSGVGLGIMFFGIFASYALSIWYGSILINSGEINGNSGEKFKAGDVLTVLFTIIFGAFSLGQTTPNIKAISEACTAAYDFFKLLERIPQIDTSRSTLKPDKDKFGGDISFKGITFKYPSRKDKIILNNLTLDLQAGKKTAIVGESGSGKSTIISLIERFYDPTQGEILIDGIDIKTLDLNYFRSMIGYVPQEPVLFNTTIKENIIFGRENVTDEEIREACKKANADEFITNIDKGYEYIVGMKGNKLSGGQKQRIAIARAILKKPKILILDEATSALDNKSEKEVQKALDSVANGITTIIIAHRLSTIINSDNIVVLKEGRIVEAGTHNQLLEKKGYYSLLIQHQMSTQESANTTEGETATKDLNQNNTKENILNLKKTTELKANVEEVDEIKQKQLLDILKQQEIEKYYESSKKKLLPLIMENKFTVIGGAFFAACSGSVWPTYGILLADSIDALSQPVGDQLKKDGENLGLYFFFLATFAGFAYLFQNYLFTAIGERLTLKLRKLTFEKYLRLHLGYYDNPEHTPGAFTTKLASDTTKINGIALSMVGISVQTFVTLILGITLGFVFDWRLALINLGFMPLIVITAALQWKLQQGFSQGDEYSEILAGSILSESVCNTKTIFSYNMQNKVVDMYNKILKSKEGSILKSAFVNGLLFGLSQLSMFATYAALFYAGGVFLSEGSLTLGKMLRSIFSILFASFGLGQAQQYVGDMAKAKEALMNIYKTLDEVSTIDPLDEKLILSGLKPEIITGKIEFKDVSFAYPSRPTQPIFEKLNFTIAPGQKAAFVGFSGSGKSTIIQLLSRFYDVSEGGIFIDDKDIRDYDIVTMRKYIGLVMQEPVLFARNFRNNVKYGKLNATDDEVDFSAGKAKITKFLEPMAFKNSITVSGGEKQRIAIARVFLKDPKILLLDEATSALDEQNEKLVQKSLDYIMEGRTTITVAHRLSTIVNSDLILFMEKGEILEQGSHEKLMSLKGRYHSLFLSANK